MFVTFYCFFFFFFFNDTATTEIYTLSLHDALPILGVHGDVAGGEDLGDVLAVGEHRDRTADAERRRPLAERLHLAPPGADEEEPRVGESRHHLRHRLEDLVVALPGARPDLRDQEVPGAEAELPADARTVHARMKPRGVGAGVDHL